MFIKIGGFIGALNTVLVIIITGILGAYLARLQGMHTLYKIQANLHQGIIPTENLIDALIILSCDVGMDTSGFCPMNCGNVNADEDELVNSTDALIILSYDVGMTVPNPVGEPGCPSSVTSCAGCE